MKDAAEKYLHCFHYDGEGPRRVGVELEFPVVSIENAEEFDVYPTLPLLAEEADMFLIYDDYYKDIPYKLGRNDGKFISLEYARGVVESVSIPDEHLDCIINRETEWINKLRRFFREHGGLMLGYGIQPVSQACKKTRTKRYEIFRKHLPPRVNYIGLTASSQVSIEISADEIVRAVNVCNALSGVSIALTANSPVWHNNASGKKALREEVWGYFAPKRSGIPPTPFSSIEEYIEYSSRFQVYLEKKGGTYVAPSPNTDFFKLMERRRDFLPHWYVHEATVWWNARPRASYGVIEIRPNCTQPHNEWETVPAMWLGIVERLDEAEELVNSVDWSSWLLYRNMCIEYGLNVANIKNIAHEFLQIAEKGLRDRKRGEEVFLEPAKRRLREEKLPADRALELFNAGGAVELSHAFS